MTRLRLATGGALLAIALALGMIFFFAPTDALQGPVQRIFYVHVSSAIAAYFCFGTVLVGSVAYLWRGSLSGDRVARSAAEVGLVFTSVTLLMGIAWAKPIWGWDPTLPWDARFTSTVVLWMVYGGYLLVRRLAAPGRQAARFAAVVGIVGFIDVPVVHFSVQWWRGLHPGPIIDNPAGPQLPPEMLVTFLVTMVAIVLTAGALVGWRYRLQGMLDEVALARSAAPPASPARVGLETEPAG